MDKFDEMEKKFARLNQQLDSKINLINQRYQETMDLLENHGAQREKQVLDGLNTYRDELLREVRSSLEDDIDKANEFREKYRPSNQSVETIPEFTTLRSSKTFVPANKALGMLKLTYPRMSRYKHWTNIVDDRNKKRDELISRNTSTRYIDSREKKWCTRKDAALLHDCRRPEEIRGAVALGVNPSNFLYRAIITKNYAMLKELLEMGAKPDNYSLFDVLWEAHDENPRLWSEEDVIAFFDQLIRYGADVNFRRFEHVSLITSTIERNFPRAALLLLRSGAIADASTAYRVAFGNDDPELLQQVINQYGNFTQFEGEEGVWILMNAGRNTLQYLMNNGLNLNDNPMLTYRLLEREDDNLSQFIRRHGNLSRETIIFLNRKAKRDGNGYILDWLDNL